MHRGDRVGIFSDWILFYFILLLNEHSMTLTISDNVYAFPRIDPM